MSAARVICLVKIVTLEQQRRALRAGVGEALAQMGGRARGIKSGGRQRGPPPGATAATRRWTSAVEKFPVRSMLA